MMLGRHALHAGDGRRHADGRDLVLRRRQGVVDAGTPEPDAQGLPSGLAGRGSRAANGRSTEERSNHSPPPAGGGAVSAHPLVACPAAPSAPCSGLPTSARANGPAVGCVIDGCPPGMALSEADISARARLPPPRHESRHVTQETGPMRCRSSPASTRGLTTGTPICLLIPTPTSAAGLRQPPRHLPARRRYTYWHHYGLVRPARRARPRPLTAPMVGAARWRGGCARAVSAGFT